MLWLLQAVISSRRLSNFLSTPEHHSSELTASADLLNHHFKRYTEVTHNPMAVVLQNVSCSWSSSSVAEPSIVLRDISLQLQKGLFIAIVGEVIILTVTFSFLYYGVLLVMWWGYTISLMVWLEKLNSMCLAYYIISQFAITCKEMQPDVQIFFYNRLI
jgi:hypothetical protein